MAKETLTIHPDGSVIRYHNRKIAFKQDGDTMMIKFLFADKDADGPACYHKCHKGKVRETFIKMNEEAFQRLIHAYVKYKKNQLTTNPINK